MHSIRLFRHYMRAPLLLLAACEGVIFAGCFIVSYQLRWWTAGAEALASTFELILYSTIVATIFVLSMGSMGLYASSGREGASGLLIRIGLSLLLGALVLAALSYLVPQLGVWRSMLVLTVGLSFLTVAGLRLVFFIYRPSLFRRRVLLFGDPSLSIELNDRPQLRLEFVGIVPAEADRTAEGPLKIIPWEKPLEQIAIEAQADEILLAVRDRRGKLPMEELLDCRMSGIDVLEPMSFFERELGVVRLDLLRPSWLLLSDGFQQKLTTTLTKRAFDLILALIFIVLFSPLMAATAFAIAIESGFRHPILYRQRRVGENGAIFEVIKFRSMRVDAEADGRARWSHRDDKRITRVGRFIRKARIDELPQVLNVLKGEMSFVGPRPERPEFVVRLAEKSSLYAARHRVKPGLTGWAQLCYPYGSTEDDALNKLEYDLYYIKNQSTFLDLLILLETVEVVLFGKGAV